MGGAGNEIIFGSGIKIHPRRAAVSKLRIDIYPRRHIGLICWLIGGVSLNFARAAKVNSHA
jgi:hypothetical protein